jgi:DNA-binding HxlR family transcriptional regulator
MRHASLTANVPCPVARSLEVVGEWWTLLIVRDALLGAKRFEEFKRTGIADNVLAARLKKLTAAGVFKRRSYQRHPVRHEYLLTEKGTSLAPVVLALRAWGTRWTNGERPESVTHTVCGEDLGVALYCPHCARLVAPGEVEAVPAKVPA